MKSKKFCMGSFRLNGGIYMKKVLGMGNALVDILVRIEDDEFLSMLGLEKSSMTLIDKERMNSIIDGTKLLKRQQSSGGSAANTINGLAYLGVSTGYIGKIGDDEFGSFFKYDMNLNKIKTNLFKGIEDTGKCIVLISKDSERTCATYLGAAIELNKNDLNEKLFEGYDYFHIEGYLVQNKDLIKSALSFARYNGVEISIDLSSFNIVGENKSFIKDLIRDYVDIVFANEDEARVFTGKNNSEDVVDEIAKNCKIAIVKCGNQGSLVKFNNIKYKIPPINVNTLDTTGAGDLYAAGFFYGLTNGYPVDICGRIGSVLGAKVVEILGARIEGKVWDGIKGIIKNIETNELGKNEGAMV